MRRVELAFDGVERDGKLLCAVQMDIMTGLGGEIALEMGQKTPGEDLVEVATVSAMVSFLAAILDMAMQNPLDFGPDEEPEEIVHRRLMQLQTAARQYLDVLEQDHDDCDGEGIDWKELFSDLKGDTG